MPKHSENEEKIDSEDESEEEVEKHKRSSKTSTRKKETAGKAKTKKITVPTKSSIPPKRTPKKSSSKRSRGDDDNDTNPKAFSRTRKNEKVAAREKASTQIRSVSREKSGTSHVLSFPLLLAYCCGISVYTTD